MIGTLVKKNRKRCAYINGKKVCEVVNESVVGDLRILIKKNIFTLYSLDGIIVGDELFIYDEPLGSVEKIRLIDDITIEFITKIYTYRFVVSQ